MDVTVAVCDASDMATHTQKIRELAVRAGLSLADVERRAGLPQARLSKAKGGMLRRDELERVAEVLGVAASAFLHAQADPDRYMLDHLIEQYGPRRCVFYILDGARRDADAPAETIVVNGTTAAPPGAVKPDRTRKAR